MNQIPTTSPEELIELAHSSDWEKRLEAARDDRAGEDILAVLASDHEWQIREAVALKGYALETLQNDPVINVANAAAEKSTELFINDPDNIERYKSLLREVIDQCTDDQTIIIEPTGYDDYFDAETVLKWYNQYCELSDKDGISFDSFILSAIIDDENGYFFRNSAEYEEDYIMQKIESAIQSEQPDLAPIFEARKEEMSTCEILEEGGLQSETINHEAFLSNNYHINLMFATPKEQNYDMGAIPTMFYESAEKSADFDYFTDNALTYLIHQQGYTLADVYEGMVHPKKVEDKKFLKSVVEEIDNFPWYSMAELTALISLSGKDLIDTLDAIANGRDYIKLSKETMIGLYNEWQGTGSQLGIELEKDAIIPTNMVRNVQFEGERYTKVHENNGYSVDDVYGLIGRCWTQGKAGLASEEPVLKEEDMKKTQAALRVLNKQAKEKTERDD
jgi:hypothetical protein